MNEENVSGLFATSKGCAAATEKNNKGGQMVDEKKVEGNGSAMTESETVKSTKNGSAATMLSAPVSQGTKTTLQGTLTKNEDTVIASDKATQTLLWKISADRPYDLWFKAGVAFKSAGGSYEEFDRWSQTAPARYDAEAVKTLWNSVEIEGGITPATLAYLAHAPESRLAPVAMTTPESPEELTAQMEQFLNTLFSPAELTEVACACWSDDHSRLFPYRKTENIKPVSQLLEELRAGVPTDGVYVLPNPVETGFLRF